MSDVAFIEGGVECTPLHFTSLHQQITDECMSRGRQDSYPLHYAAAHSSVTAFKYLVDKACSLDSTQHELMRLRDDEDFTPLHSAVSSGSLEMVECCLQYGSPIELTENTGCTALHMACAQGSPNIVEILLNSEDGCKVIDHNNIVGQTALHTAAKYNHVDVAKVLIQRGCNLDEKDNDGLTPLLLAALMDSWLTSWLLLEHNASLTNTDATGRNLLHLVVYKASTIISMPVPLYKTVEEKLSSLVNIQDKDGNSPLHCAVEYGGISQVQRMLYLGAAPWLHNNRLQTPFHIAAALGRSDCIQIMMKTPSKLSINQVGQRNQTPVHQAAGNGHVEVVRILLKSGAITRGDLFGQTPFHASAKGGHTEVARELLTLRSRSMLHEQDKSGNTALHLAALEDHPHMVSFLLTEHAQLNPNANGDYVFDVATNSLNRKATIALTLHNRWHECLSFYNRSKGLPINRLIKSFPAAAKVVLDRSKESADIDSKNEEYWINYDFRYLCNDVKSQNVQHEIDMKPFSALNTMIEFNRTDLLGHPVCDKYLDLKWEYYGLVTHTIRFLFFATYVSIYTYFILSVDFNKFQCATNTTQNCRHVGRNEFTGGQTVSLILLLVYNLLSFILNIKILHSWGWWALLSLEKIAEHVMLFVVMIFAVPLLIIDEFSYHWQWEFGVLGLFMAWVFTLHHLKRTSPFGILIMMFFEVLATMTRILIVFGIEIIGLAVCFHALLGKDEGQPFQHLLLSFVRIFDMMIGEIDFINSFAKPVMDEDPKTAHFQWAILVLVSFFILTVTIALMNLMIGLAIGDIEKIGKMAKYQQQKLIIAFYMQFEITFPMISEKYFDKNSLTVFPNKKNKTSFLQKITEWSVALFGNIQVIEDFKNEATNEPITLSIEARIFNRLNDVEKRLQDITEALTALNKAQIPSEATAEEAHIPDAESGT